MTVNEKGLEPCACGGVAALYYPDPKSETRFAANIVCHHCGVSMQTAGHDSNPARVIAAWNLRAASKAPPGHGPELAPMSNTVSNVVTYLRYRARVEQEGGSIYATTASRSTIYNAVADEIESKFTAIEPVAASPGVPDGWKLVPVEPTEAMMRAAMDRLGWTTRPTPPEYENFGSARISDGLSEEDAAQIDGELAMEFREVYRAVLAAAPASPEPSPASEDAQARIETLERALRQVREAITAPVNALAITDTVWMPLPQNAASSIETMVDFIDAALSPSTNGAEK